MIFFVICIFFCYLCFTKLNPNSWYFMVLLLLFFYFIKFLMASIFRLFWFDLDSSDLADLDSQQGV